MSHMIFPALCISVHRNRRGTIQGQVLLTLRESDGLQFLVRPVPGKRGFYFRKNAEAVNRAGLEFFDRDIS